VIINDFLYGDADGKDLPASLEEHYDTLKSWTSKQWADLITKYYTAAAHIVIRGKPSAALQQKLEADEKARVAAQVNKLGPEGLAELEQKLAAAKEEHEQPIPEDMLTSFPVPDVKSISWISVQSAKNSPKPSSGLKGQHPIGSPELERHLAQDNTALPMTVQFDHVTVSQA
jgi:Zn-dependent M16 (insulinase) family peptidase